jgi:putative membrane protein
MNAKFKFISKFAILALMAGALCAAATVWAIGEDYQDVSANPYLRRATPKPKSTVVPKPVKSLSAKDQKFLTSALAAGIWEVENGRAAESKAQNAATKRVAARLVEENSRLNQEIIDLGKKKGLGLSPEGARAQKFPGGHFDKDYLTLAKRDHQENVRVFEKEATSGDDPDLKKLAARALPNLRHQLGSVEEALGQAK